MTKIKGKISFYTQGYQQVQMPCEIETDKSIGGEQGPQGKKGDKGDPLTYNDLTEAQKADIARPATEQAEIAVQQLEAIHQAIDNLDPSQSTSDAIVAEAATRASKDAELEADLAALGPKIEQVEYSFYSSAFDEIVRYLKYSNGNIATSQYNTDRVWYKAVTAGQIFKVTATNDTAKACRVGFTTAIPANEVAVTGVKGGSITELDETLVAPFDGYLVLIKNSAYFTDHAVKGGIKRIDNVEKAVAKNYEDVVVAAQTKRDRIILTSGVWGSNTNSKHIRLDAAEGDMFAIKGNNTHLTYAYFVSAYNVVQGGNASVIEYKVVPMNDTINIVAPQGTKYLVLTCESYSGDTMTYDGTPASIIKDNAKASSVIVQDLKLLGTSIMANEQVFNGKYLSSGEWTHTYNLSSAIFAVKPKDILTIKANAGYDTSYKFLNANLAMVDDGGTISVDATKSNIVVPDNAAYLYCYYAQDNTTYGYRGRPEYILSAYGQVSLASNKTENVLTLVPKTDLKKYVAQIDTTNLVWKNTAYISILMPVVGGKKYELGRANGTPSSNTHYLIYAWLTSKAVVVGEAPDFASGHSQVYNAPIGQNVAVTAPSDAKYLYVYAGSSPNYNYLAKYIKCIDGSVETAMAILNDKDEENDNTGIVALNDPIKTVNLLQQMNRRYAGTGNTQLVLLHFSDIHADTTALGRIKDYYAKYSQYITDVLNTGDTCNGDPTDVVMTSFYTGTATKFLTVIGNHDASTGGGHPDTAPYPQEDTYAEFIAPFVANWNVTQPDDAATECKCYYYKDYADSKLRLIVLDEYHYDADQDSWLAATLAETLDSTNSAYGYHVIMATHSANGALINRCTNFTDFANGGGYEYGDEIGSETLNAVEQVQTFIGNGGILVAWLYGHAHYDNVGYSDIGDGKSQLRICCSTANPAKAGNYGVARVVGTKSQDCFNIVSVDTNRGYIRVFRVGADYDMLLKHRGGFCIDYINHDVVSNW